MSKCQFKPSILGLINAVAGVALLLGAVAAHAQWTLRAAPEPYVRGLSVFRDAPVAGTTTLAAATLGAGVFKGDDNGATWNWRSINNGLPTGRIWTLNSSDVNTYFVGTDGSGIYKTADGGASWQPMNGSGAGALGCMDVRDLDFVGTTFYAATRCRYNSGIYKSSDNGATWARIGTSVIPPDVEGNQITLNSTGTLVLFATRSNGIYKSTDSGVTWAAANTGITGTNPDAGVVQCSTTCATLLVFIRGQGIYKSTNTGASWSLSSAGLPAGGTVVTGIQRDGSTTPPTFYMAFEKQGIYRSTNDGASWAAWGNTASLPGVAYARQVRRDTTAPGKFYVTALDGVRKTVDDGLSFSSSPMGGGKLNNIIHDVANPAVAYLTTTATLFKNTNIYSGDPNAAPTLIDSGITGSTLDGRFAQDLKKSSVMYQTTGNRGIFRSVDGGASWTAINAGLPALFIDQPGRVTIDRNNTQILYLGFPRGGGLYKSTDGGTSWTAASSGLTGTDARSVQRIEVDRNNSSVLYATTDDGLYKSTSAAGSWTLVYSALDAGGKRLPVSHVRINPSNSQEIYIANPHTEPSGTLVASAGIHKSTDGGATWTNVLPGKNASTVRVSQGGEIFAGISGTFGQPAVFRSTDGGATWQDYSGGLQGPDISTFGIDPNNDRVLSLSLENGFYTLSTSTPVAPATPLPPPPVAQTAYTVSNGRIADAAVQVSATGTFGSATLKVTLDLLKGVTPAAATTGFAATLYNVYVVALVPGAAVGSTVPVLFAKPKAPGDWGVLKSPIAAFLEGVSDGAANGQVVLDILSNTNISTLVGTEFYVGYGTSDQEMLAAGRFRGVFKVQ